MIDHPLFPAADDDPEPPDVETIHVTRFERGASPAVWCPRVFQADELPGLDAVHELFGGGSYELIARSTKSGRNVISARRRYLIPGASLPLAGDPTPAAPSVPTPVASAPTGGSIWMMLLPLIPPLLQAWMSSQKEHTAMLMAMMQNQQQTTLAMAQSSKQDANAFIQAMAKLNEGEKAMMMGFITELAKQKSSGGGEGSLDALMAGLELGKDLGGGATNDNDMGQIAQLVQGLAALKAASKDDPPSQPSAPAAPTPPQG